MSLFQTRELWSYDIATTYDTAEQEECSSVLSLDIVSLTNDSDTLLVGMGDGTLYALRPADGKSTDEEKESVLLKMKLPNLILQILVGRFKSNSEQQHLAVLHPNLLAVYVISGTFDEHEGKSKSVTIQLLYERTLEHSAYNLISGPLGGRYSGEFICVQCMGGKLCVFEQEANYYGHQLPSLLLPGAICYAKSWSMFVIFCTTLELQAFKYDNLLFDSTRKTSTSTNDANASEQNYLKPEWTMLIGEKVSQLSSVETTETGAILIVLGEQNVFFINSQSSIISMQRMDYTPLCLHTYGTAFDDTPRYLIATEEGTLLLYNNMKLTWAAKLSFPPVCVRLAHIKHTRGIIVALGANGVLLCAFLGTEPILEQAISKRRTRENYEKRLNTMKEITQEIKSLKTTLDTTKALHGQHDLHVESTVIEPSNENGLMLNNQEDELNSPEIIVQVRLVQRKQINNLSISLQKSTFLAIEPNAVFFAASDEILRQEFRIHKVPGRIPTTRTIILDISYTDSSNKQMVCTETVDLPIEFIYVKTERLSEEGKVKLELSLDDALICLQNAFPGFSEKGEKGEPLSEISFSLRVSSGKFPPINVKASKYGNVQIEGDFLDTLWLPMAMILQPKNDAACDNRLSRVKVISQLPLKEFCEIVARFEQLAQQMAKLRSALTSETVQLRVLQRQFFARLKNPSKSNVTIFRRILNSKCVEVVMLIDAVNKLSEPYQIQLNSLKAASLLMTTMLISKLCLPENLIPILRAALYVSECDFDSQGWLSNCCSLLDVCIEQLSGEDLNKNPVELSVITDFEKFKRKLKTLIDKAALNRTNTSALK